MTDRLSSYLNLPRAEPGLREGGGESSGAPGTAVYLFDPLHLLCDCWHHQVPEAPTPVNRSMTFL